MTTGRVSRAMVRDAQRMFGCPQRSSTPPVSARSIPPPTNWTKKPRPNSPNTIAGTPASVFTANLIARATRDVLLAYSLRYSAVTVPMGTPARDMMMTRSAVPTIAGKIPPSVMPSDGAAVRNSQLIVSFPPMTIVAITKMTTATISRADIADSATTARPSILLFIMAQPPRKRFSRR
jgi:hypothetical protein